jgi:hypothetical protein
MAVAPGGGVYSGDRHGGSRMTPDELPKGWASTYPGPGAADVIPPPVPGVRYVVERRVEMDGRVVTVRAEAPSEPEAMSMFRQALWETEQSPADFVQSLVAGGPVVRKTGERV